MVGTMFVALNDAIVSAAKATLPVMAEGLRFGSGCFETIAYTGGQPRFWQRHMERFTHSCTRLGIEPKVSPIQLRQFLAQLVEKNAAGAVLPTEGVVRVSAHQCGSVADVVVTLSPPRYSRPPEFFTAMLSQQHHAGVWPLSGIKHNNYVQYLAAGATATAAGFDEALLTDVSGYVLEGSRTNLFAVEKTDSGWLLRTAPIVTGVLPGVMRAVVLDIAPELGFEVSETAFKMDELLRADACFLTNALVGVVPVACVGNHRFDAEANLVASALRQAILRLRG